MEDMGKKYVEVWFDISFWKVSFPPCKANSTLEQHSWYRSNWKSVRAKRRAWEESKSLTKPTNLQPTVTSLKHLLDCWMARFSKSHHVFIFFHGLMWYSSSSSCSVKADNLMTCSSSSMINAGSKPRCFQHNMCTATSATMLLLLILPWYVFFLDNIMMYPGILCHCWWHVVTLFTWYQCQRSKLSTDGEKAIPTCTRLKNQDVFKATTSGETKDIQLALGFSNLQILY